MEIQTYSDFANPEDTPLPDGWTCFCSKSSMDTFFVLMYNTEDCRTSSAFFPTKNIDETDILQKISAFIHACINSKLKAVRKPSRPRRTKTPKTDSKE